MEKIDPSSYGLDAAWKREQENHPLDPGTGAWTRRTNTLKTLVQGHNELTDRVPSLEARIAALEAAANQTPFP